MRQALSFALAIAFPLVAAAEPLKQEPESGSMPTGSIVYVDDGTCPAAQIKKVVIGSTAKNIPRVRSCVSLDTMRAEAAAAKTWTVHLVLNEARSRRDCVKTTNWRLELKDDTLSAFSNNGKAFSIPLAADGAFDHKFILSHGSMQMVGNVKSGEYELYALSFGCFWKSVGGTPR
jgi:hypothetical protein